LPQPSAQLFEQRSRSGLPDLRALVRRPATDFGLDYVEAPDSLQGFGRDRRVVRLVDVVEGPARVRLIWCTR
jgi:hypothetical protein